MAIKIKTPEEIEIMKDSGKMLASILKELEKATKPGVTTQDLNKLAQELVLKFGARSSFLNYNGYPVVICY